MDWEKLLRAVVPTAVALARPGQSGASFVQGFQQSDQLMFNRRMQEEEAARRRAALEAETQNRAADNERQDQMARLNRLSLALQQLQPAIGAQAETATDPTQAVAALGTQSGQLERSFGLDPGAMTPFVPSAQTMAPLISSRQIKRAKDKVVELQKLYGDKLGDVADSLTIHEGEFAGRTVAEVVSLAQMEPPPKSAPKTPNRNLQSKEVMRGGKRAFANFEPDTGKYFDVGSGQEVTDISPVPPASAQNQPSGLPPRTQQRVDATAKGFDTQPVVKNIQKMAEAVTFANSLDVNTKNAADDQALIYAFAKAMDPDSVVREGEYATVQKYAQSWAETFGFNAARIFSNTSFLSPQARQNMKATIQKKFAAGKVQYDNLRKSYGSRIDKLTGEPGTGESWLIDYGGGFPTTEEPSKGGPVTVTDPQGGRHTFPNQAAADAFKKAAGIP